jgi:hypothetical protein
MEIDIFKIVALISAIIAIGDKVYTYGKPALASLKKSNFYLKIKPNLSLKKISPSHMSFKKMSQSGHDGIAAYLLCPLTVTSVRF